MANGMIPPSQVALRVSATAALLLLPVWPTLASDAVLDAMQQEIERSVETLADQPTPLYFLSYEITEERAVSARASFGALAGRAESERRLLDIDLRVGSHDLDNTRPIRGRGGSNRSRFSRLEVPVADIDALRSTLWIQTDRKYKEATEELTKVKTNIQVTVQDEERTADFSAEAQQQSIEPERSFDLDLAAWEDRLKRYSAPFSRSPHVYAADAIVSGSVVTRWYVNSEGTTLRTSEPRVRLVISARTKADDGMELPRYESFFAFAPSGLPDDAAVLDTVSGMMRDLEGLRNAPLAEPYTGPAILSGRASGVFFHEILGHRVEGHRQKRDQDAQTFGRMLGEAVLPEAFSVVFDPTITHIGSTDLAGSYRYDNQGVKARRVPVIQGGVLERFLMSRTPIKGFDRSNGHGRKQAGFAPVSRQSNLFVEVSEPRSEEELKQELIALLGEQGKEYGLYFEDVQGGFTFTGRTVPNAFNVTPVVVYRIYPDGREELVRGVDLIGTPLTTFSKVISAGGDLEVFNGTCGAESGGVPVSAASPAILVSQVEVQKKAKSQVPLPLLPAPDGPLSAPRTLESGGVR